MNDLTEKPQQSVGETAARTADILTSDIPAEGFNARIPDKYIVRQIIRTLRAVVFPQFLHEASTEYRDVRQGLVQIYSMLKPEIISAFMFDNPGLKSDDTEKLAEKISLDFISAVPDVRRMLIKDIDAGFNGDPAAKSREDIIISYPGLTAIFVYRFAHILYKAQVPLIPRIMTEYAHSRTGIDINAGAQIGEYFFIDHGTGVVIGETTIIGNRVKLYQGVTLGALSTRKGQQLSGVKRHPTIEDDVTVYANATILGGDTIIGRGSVIGGSAFITKPVPPYTKVIVKNQELIFKTAEKEIWEI